MTFFIHFTIDEIDAFTEPTINYQWADYVPVEVHNRINMPMFHHLIGYNKRNSFELESSMSNRTSLIVELFFSRSIGYYMLNVYIPITIVVVMSWIPFWLNRNDHLMRIIFEAIITLIMTTMIVNVNSIIPQAIHWKMIDLYLFGCLSTILLSMFECTLISYFEYKNKKMTQLGASILVTGRVVMYNTNIIDRMARVLCPSIFLMLNTFYFGTLLIVYHKNIAIEVQL